MRLRWKHSPALAAAAVGLACLTPDASATTSGAATPPISVVYSAQTVALSPGGGTVIVPNGTTAPAGLHYTTTTGQFNGDAIVFVTQGSGTTFTGSAVAICVGPCNPANTYNVAGFGSNTVTVTIVSPAVPPALAIGPGATIVLTSTATPPAPPAPFPTSTLGVAGVTNLASPSAAGPLTANGTQTQVFGVANTSVVPVTPATLFAPGNLGDTVTVQATQPAANLPPVCAACIVTSDPNPLPDFFFTSQNSFVIAPAGVTQLIDLGATGGSVPGTQFQRQTSAATGSTPTVSTAGFLGTMIYSNSAGLLDARFGNACCNNSGNTTFGNSPLNSTANVVIRGDFQTIVQAYLRPGNNVPGGVTNPVAGAVNPVEQAPSANTTCTPTQTGPDIPSSPQPTGAGQNTLTFGIPSSLNSVNGLFINQLTLALCVVTNGTNVIADTLGNTPGAGAAGGPAGGSTWTVTVTVPGITPDIGLVTNGKPGFDIAYAGGKFVFPNVFPSSSGFPTWFRLVNTGVGTSTIFALIQRDGLGPVSIPGSFAALTPFTAFYALADSIASQGGIALTAHSTVTLLTPQPPGSLSITRMTGEPSGDIVLTPAGL
jgi:hypothetical protein